MVKHQLERRALVITVETVDSVYFGICLKFSIMRYQEEEEEEENREGGSRQLQYPSWTDVPWPLLDFLTDLNWGARGLV